MADRPEELLQRTAKQLVAEATAATAEARDLSVQWRARNRDRTELPDDLAWAWNSSQDLKDVAAAVYSLTLTVAEAFRRVRKEEHGVR